MTSKEKKQYADYIKKAATTKSLIGDLQAAVNNHNQDACGRMNIGNWGYNGDLEHVNNELALVLGFLTGDCELADNGIAAYKS